MAKVVEAGPAHPEALALNDHRRHGSHEASGAAREKSFVSPPQVGGSQGYVPRGGFLKISFSRHSDLRRPTSTLRRPMLTLRRPYVDPMLM